MLSTFIFKIDRELAQLDTVLSWALALLGVLLIVAAIKASPGVKAMLFGWVVLP